MRAALAAAFILVAGGLAIAAPAQAQVYWRADIGWSMSKDAQFKDKNFQADGVICGNPSCTTPGALKDLGDSYIIGAGLGYRFDRNWRADLTFANRGGYSLTGSDAGGAQFKSDINSTVLMLNGYYDFESNTAVERARFIPYIGLGVGWAQNRMDPIVQTFPGGTITTPSGKKDNTAGALMAGVGMPLGSLILDLGYRYMDLGRIQGGTGTATFNGIPFLYSGADGRLQAHELTIGLRF
jgi:opacity protein-like surface antigen